MTTPEIPWSRVDTSGGPGACWPWLGAISSRGYGKLSVKSRAYYAHRLALEHKIGRPIKPGMLACHSCDNRSCCNPGHIWEGTSRDNIMDMFSKGRANRASGEKHRDAKLSPEKISVIRQLRDRGVTWSSVARRFGVNPATAWRAFAGRTWRNSQPTEQP